VVAQEIARTEIKKETDEIIKYIESETGFKNQYAPKVGFSILWETVIIK
jgi:hypothetical protein